MTAVPEGLNLRVCFGQRETDVEAQRLPSETGESVELSIRKPHFDNDVSSLVPAELMESLTKCGPISQARFARLRRQHPILTGFPPVAPRRRAARRGHQANVRRFIIYDLIRPQQQGGRDLTEIGNDRDDAALPIHHLQRL